MTNNQIKALFQYSESEWLEFKRDNTDPKNIGENISAISNSIALLGRSCGYIVWGVESNGKDIIGTKFKPREHKVGNEELENWLLTQLRPQVNFIIHEKNIDKKRVVFFEISSSKNQPVKFKGVAYIRIGSYTKKLNDHPEKERSLWQVFNKISFEKDIAIENIESSEVLKLIDYPGYFKKMNELLPESHKTILARLVSEKIIVKKNGSNIYSITNLGAILFCNDLRDFSHFIKKSPRIIVYKGSGRIEGVREKEFTRGYALDFENIVDYIDSQIPKKEEIGKAFRKEISAYPKPAIRELVANALIHQDFNSKGSSLLIEIFSDRIEISNPGKPLIETLRFIDEPPKSRNESIVSFMRRMDIAEDRGSGIDKVIKEIELHQSPAPDFRETQFSTVAILYAKKSFSQMENDERVRACYQHACLQWVLAENMDNTSLRKRFGIEEKNYSMISRIIKECLNKNLIKRKTSSTRNRLYIPFWAS